MWIKLILSCAFISSAFSVEIDEAIKRNLVAQAAEARQKAYAPYSNYYVGSAVLAADGTVYQGCNVENASYGLTCCAERTAIFKAVSEGKKEFLAIAISALGGGAPCGACRQVINEFGPELPVYLGDDKGNFVRETTLEVLLPHAFGPANLGK